MKTPGILFVAATALTSMLTVSRPEVAAPVRTAPASDDDAACRACHPGPTRGLRQGPHAILLDPGSEHASCTSCHGDQSAHATSRIDPKLAALRAAPVAASSCTPCHQGREFTPAAAAHPWTRHPSRQPKVEIDSIAPSFNITDWSVMTTAGWRFLDKHGSRNRYDTDLNLDRGPRLMEFEVEGITRGEGAWMDLVRISASNIDDPYQQVTGLIEKNDHYRAEAGFQKTAVTYSALGNFHRVDRKSQETRFSSSIELTDNLELFGGFSRFMQDGFWLTHRIGDLNISPLTTIDDVESPRSHDAEEGELGLAGTAWDTQFTVALDYANHKDRNRWLYSQPSSNPSFPQSEDFTSRGRLSGPGLRWSLSRSFDSFTIEHSGRYLDRDKTISADGKKTGHNTVPFNTTTTAAASGQARTWICDTTATMELASWASLLVDTRWLDHAEEMQIAQTDVTFFPTLNTTTTTTTNRTQRTTQRSLEGSLQFDLRPWPYLDLTAGYGWSREDLTVPNLDPGGSDFHSGRIRTDGVLLGAAFRPDSHWTLETRLRNFGQNGIQLHDIVEDESRLAELQLRHRRDSWQAQAWARHRRRANDISSMRNETSSAGIGGSWNSDDSVELYTSYVFSDIESRTLTNFYFDPDPDPVPTFVGFDGQTHTVIVGIGLSPTERVRWRLDATYTDTSGSFDIGLLDWSSDLSVAVGHGGEAGVLLRQIEYDEQGGGDDYGAFMTFVYYRQRFGGNGQD